VGPDDLLDPFSDQFVIVGDNYPDQSASFKTIRTGGSGKAGILCTACGTLQT
jgi:hypothetical protein